MYLSKKLGVALLCTALGFPLYSSLPGSDSSGVLESVLVNTAAPTATYTPAKPAPQTFQDKLHALEQKIKQPLYLSHGSNASQPDYSVHNGHIRVFEPIAEKKTFQGGYTTELTLQHLLDYQITLSHTPNNTTILGITTHYPNGQILAIADHGLDGLKQSASGGIDSIVIPGSAMGFELNDLSMISGLAYDMSVGDLQAANKKYEEIVDRLLSNGQSFKF